MTLMNTAPGPSLARHGCFNHTPLRFIEIIQIELDRAFVQARFAFGVGTVLGLR